MQFDVLYIHQILVLYFFFTQIVNWEDSGLQQPCTSMHNEKITSNVACRKSQSAGGPNHEIKH